MNEKPIVLKCCARKHRPKSTAGFVCARALRMRVFEAMKRAPMPIIHVPDDAEDTTVYAVGGTD